MIKHVLSDAVTSAGHLGRVETTSTLNSSPTLDKACAVMSPQHCVTELGLGTAIKQKCSGWGATGISDTYTALLYELAFTATRSVSGYCCKLSNVELG